MRACRFKPVLLTHRHEYVRCMARRLDSERQKALSAALENARMSGELESCRKHIALIESHSNSWREHATNVVQSGLIDNRLSIVQPKSGSSHHGSSAASQQSSASTSSFSTPQSSNQPMMWSQSAPMMYVPHMMAYSQPRPQPSSDQMPNMHGGDQRASSFTSSSDFS